MHDISQFLIICMSIDVTMMMKFNEQQQVKQWWWLWARRQNKEQEREKNEGIANVFLIDLNSCDEN